MKLNFINIHAFYCTSSFIQQIVSWMFDIWCADFYFRLSLVIVLDWAWKRKKLAKTSKWNVYELHHLQVHIWLQMCETNTKSVSICSTFPYIGIRSLRSISHSLTSNRFICTKNPNRLHRNRKFICRGQKRAVCVCICATHNIYMKSISTASGGKSNQGLCYCL